jgi:hypothetical protein
MYRAREIFLYVAVALAIGCTQSVIKHQPAMAANAAETFARLAFVERNYGSAINFVKGGNSIDDVSAMVERLHPTGSYPVRVVAASYEPMPGKESMKIYLEGSGAEPSYHYLAVMEGTEPNGYKVSAIARSEDPFPGSNSINPLR